MKKSLFASALIAALAIPAIASASCSTIGSTTSCYDHNSGNSTTTQRIGGQSFTNGHNANTGASWNSNTQRIGSQSFTNGSSSNGSSWNSNTQRIGSQSFTNGSTSSGTTWNSNSNRTGNTLIQNGSTNDGRSWNSTTTYGGNQATTSTSYNNNGVSTFGTSTNTVPAPQFNQQQFNQPVRKPRSW